ncbi:hypothetical protein [Candidatus Carsonella ruddii]|uniref:hypothetical protein n=2 Tax=Carsonella ruddii TaxID=114186 RepID=UPI00035BFF90|nr:hypothetical protein [Candidatus Carsonella ruddii]AGS06687.1 hypothetical protein CRDC_01015 [Candidatus Carsonella ruddii DC]ALA96914.1 hypothetical protein AMC76_01070 [Candidatus Carsonella ruddii]
MIFNKIYHIFLIFFKIYINNYVKVVNIGTNSINCFIKTNKKNFFYSITVNNLLKLNNIKIFQNKIKFPLTKIIFNYKVSLYFKNNGFMNDVSNVVSSKISFLLSNLSIKKFLIKKNKINFFIIRNKNFLSKKNYFRLNILNSISFSHNDIFKDNILLNGLTLTSVIDLNNFFFFKNSNDLYNLIIEFSKNYIYKKVSILENYYKNKKYFVLTDNYIFKIFFLRKKKFFYSKKIKNPINYLKKYFFYEKF